MNDALVSFCVLGSGDELVGALCEGRASELRRKEMNEVLPLFFAPMTRILERH